MSRSTPRSPGRPNVDWDALVARKVARHGEIEAALDRADAYERLGEYQLAVKWLDLASELSGGLSRANGAQRARLARERDADDNDLPAPVRDADFTPSRPRFHGDESGGWGLVLVDRMATRWAVARGRSGKCVWFENEF